MNNELFKRTCGTIGLALLVLGIVLDAIGVPVIYVLVMLAGVLFITYSLYTSTYQITPDQNGMDEESFRR
jgi:hypothetical protein